MTDLGVLMLSLFAGVCLGGLFFEGLWRTVSRAAQTARPEHLFVLSFAIRTAILLSLLWLVSRGNAMRLAACMIGFLCGRAVILKIHRGGKQLAN
jgi:F1F0 ATPase subunit 2